MALNLQDFLKSNDESYAVDLELKKARLKLLQMQVSTEEKRQNKREKIGVWGALAVVVITTLPVLPPLILAIILVIKF